MVEKSELEQSAANGLLNRRHLLGLGLAGISSVAGHSVLAADSSGVSISSGADFPAWSKAPGPGSSAYGAPSPYAANYQRITGTENPFYPGGGASRSPLHLLQGSITPNGLHFERHHSGVPDINPAQHSLIIHGLVKQALAFSYEKLLSYPMVSKIYFLECSGNSGALVSGNPRDASAGSLHGLVSCAEWTGVLLSTLLDEVGVDASAKWIGAVGADAASMGRSIPLAKAMDDVLIALYQNGEPLRPSQGYPMRLFVPGWEGNTSVKWLTQLKVLKSPAQFRDETSKYTDTQTNRKSLQFTFPMGVKSVITSPSGQMNLKQPGVYQVTGIAWSGHGSIRKVEISADGGSTWAEAMIESTRSDLALCRFRIPWQWQGGEAILQSRATDSKGNIQPTRKTFLANNGGINRYHYHAIQSWAVSTDGSVRNTYA